MAIAPALFVGLATVGFAAPASADTTSSDSGSTVAATNTPATSAPTTDTGATPADTGVDNSTPSDPPATDTSTPSDPPATDTSTPADSPATGDTGAGGTTPATGADNATQPTNGSTAGTGDASTSAVKSMKSPQVSTLSASSVMSPMAVSNPTVTVQKTWVNGIAGDKVSLLVDYDVFFADSATSTSNGIAGSWTDTGNQAVLAVPAGKTVSVSEWPVLGSPNEGHYYPSLSCPGVHPFLGFFTMPATNVVCTFTNTRHVATHTVTVTKTWVNGVDGDSVNLTVASEGDNFTDTATSASGGQQGSWTDTANPATIEMPVGYRVNVVEAAAGPVNGSYDAPTMTCDGVTPSGGTFIMPDGDVNCTVTNTAIQSTVTLQKEWVAGVDGDTAALSINGGESVTSTSDGDRGAVIDTTNVATATVSQGSLVTVAELLGEGNAGVYDPSVTCTGGALPNAEGTFRMPQADVTCTYENRAHQHTLRLQKEWVNGVEGDQATITIDNAGFVAPTTSTSNGQPGSWVDSDHAVQIPASAGSTVNVSEVLGDNTGTYDTSVACDGAEPDQDGNFVMPDAAVTCTITNVAMQTVTLQKEWVNGTKGDTASLTINDGDPVVSTSNGAKGSWIDSDDVAVVEVPVGSVASVAEKVGASNKGTYEKPVLTCTGDVVLDGGSFTVPQSAVTCTFTNKAVSVTPLIPITPVKPAATLIGLASTGSDLVWPIGFGGGLAALGVLIALVAWTRRRREDGQPE